MVHWERTSTWFYFSSRHWCEKTLLSYPRTFCIFLLTFHNWPVWKSQLWPLHSSVLLAPLSLWPPTLQGQFSLNSFSLENQVRFTLFVWRAQHMTQKLKGRNMTFPFSTRCSETWDILNLLILILFTASYNFTASQVLKIQLLRRCASPSWYWRASPRMQNGPGRVYFSPLAYGLVQPAACTGKNQANWEKWQRRVFLKVLDF